MKTPRYSLRSLLAFTAIAGLFAALCQWFNREPEWIVAYGLLMVGVAAVARGLLLRNWFVVACGWVFLIGAMTNIVLSIPTSVGTSTSHRQIVFSVYDAATRQPIGDANAWLYNSETSPASTDREAAHAHSRGRMSIEFAYSSHTRSSSLARHRQIYAKYDRLHVTASGYKEFDTSAIEFFGLEDDRYRKPPRVYLEPIGPKSGDR